MSVSEHKKKQSAVKCMVITVSDTRTEETDKSGTTIKKLLLERNHQISDYKIVRDEKEAIRQAVESGIAKKDVEAVIINGGTGMAKRDVTIETVSPLFEKDMPGFGEIFRTLSYKEDIGSAAILSRATAGVANNTMVFSIPGSTGAVRLALHKLILPELSHIIKEIKKDL
ncbi:MogA/MoaB family molybdenum cofactor biosynthesis protein [Halobacillus massiliensis]|uniref:MogA/MoaB family molybdenum cofactor biosynthesis protein n=1 Tax=Halobacillus massiliensis TaxID=1926286 RepID=UPI0009E24E38|nr:MogA/MoaB family molybdenum cofactor biosynthesis protein [Halobacillus massiliensis]